MGRLARTEAGGRLKRKKDKNQNHGARDQFCLISKRLQDYKMMANTRSRDRNDGLYKFWRENYVRMDSCCLPEINKKNKVVHLKRINLHIGKCSENTRKSEERSTCKKCRNCGHTEMLVESTQNLQTNLQTKNVTKQTYKWLCKMLQRRCGDVDWSEELFT